MSSILKALKKLENDNTSCKPGQLKIDAKILQERSDTGISRPTALVFFIIFVAMGSGSTYFVMKQQTKTKAPAILNSNISESDQKPTQQEIVTTPSPVTTAPASTGQQAPSLTARPVIRSVREQTKTPSFPPPATTSSATEKHATPERSPATPPPTVQQPPPTNQAPPNITRPALTVNGIASQDGNSENFAVINGTTVSMGSVIEGVKVEEIRNDRVRFSHNGESFEIILNKSNR